jgi:3-hydroxyisobutyrate dehydrogenase-like beta-hydroxyacid dehydrogenase
LAAYVTGSLRVAVVGTGRMGTAMVGRLVLAGHRVTVYNRTRTRAEALAAAHGVSVAANPRGAASTAEVVIVSLADDAAVRAAYLGSDGLVAGLRTGTVVADTSTVDPATIRALAPEVARLGATLVDTPVSGSVSTVESGQLLVMAGGDEAALARVRPVLEAFASQVIRLGALGSGATMKLVVNSMVHGLNAALAESLVLAEKAGVERSAAYEVIAASAVAAPFVVYKRAAYEHPDETPVAFALDLVAKDLDLAASLAARVGAEVPQLTTNRAVVQRALNAGLGQADLSALAALFR